MRFGLHSTTRRIPALAALPLPLLQGCPQPCQGPGCGADFNTATVVILDGQESLVEGSQDPRQAWGSVRGLEGQGVDWALLPAAGALVVGVPELSAVASLRLDSGGERGLAQAGGVLASDAARDGFGTALADVDGDLLVGAPFSRQAVQDSRQGRVERYPGAGAGFDGRLTTDDASLRLWHEESGALLGQVLAACGDLDGDGVADLAVAAPGASGGAAMAGEVLALLSGQADAGSDTLLASDLPTRWFATDTGARAGAALRCAHDLDGDGSADLLVGVPFEDGDGEARGAVHWIPGGEAMWTATGPRTLSESSRRTLRGTEDEAWLGTSLGSADLDGDGLVDIVAGSPGSDGARGEVRAWLSGPRVPGFVLVGERTGDAFGATLLLLDRDRDGRTDLLVGAPSRNPDPERADISFRAGAVYVFLNPTAAGSWPLSSSARAANTTFASTQQYLGTGRRMAAADIDQDGWDELVLLHRTDTASALGAGDGT